METVFFSGVPVYDPAVYMEEEFQGLIDWDGYEVSEWIAKDVIVKLTYRNVKEFDTHKYK